MEGRMPYERELGEDAYHVDRREIIRADLMKRLRKVCANFSESDFRSLVEGMTEQKIKGERRPL